jgi:hypothetical protein
MTDILDRLDAAIGGPDRRTKDGRRTRRYTPLKVETALLVDAKVEIENLRRQRDAYANEITGSLLPANERLRNEEVRLTREVGKLRLLLCEWLGDEPGPPGESLVSRSREAVGDVGQ